MNQSASVVRAAANNVVTISISVRKVRTRCGCSSQVTGTNGLSLQVVGRSDDLAHTLDHVLSGLVVVHEVSKTQTVVVDVLLRGEQTQYVSWENMHMGQALDTKHINLPGYDFR